MSPPGYFLMVFFCYFVSVVVRNAERLQPVEADRHPGEANAEADKVCLVA